MTNSLLYETFVYGNLEFLKKDFPLNKYRDILKKALGNKDINLGDQWWWRFYKNFKLILNNNELSILNENKDFSIYLEMIKLYTGYAEKNIKDFYIKTEKITEKDYLLISILALIQEIKSKFNSYFTENKNIDKYYKKFSETCSKYLTLLNNKIFYCDYIIPYEDNIWTSSWNFTYENKTINLAGIDTFTDVIFQAKNIKYNNLMEKEIILLKDRIIFLKKYATVYYNEFISHRLNNITEKLFKFFPFSIIYKDYRKIIDLDDNIYVTDIVNSKKIDINNDDIWMLIILPRIITSYILGFPVISCDVPTNKNLQKKLEIILEKGIDKYFENIAAKNNEIIKNKTLDLRCGNNTDDDDEDMLDLLFNKIKFFNSDDIVIFFNQGLYHVFTYPEFNDLLQKERNPYNRNPINILNNIIANIKFKKKIKRILNNRFLSSELNGTMDDNFKEIKEKLKNTIIQDHAMNYRDTITGSLLQLLLNDRFSF